MILKIIIYYILIGAFIGFSLYLFDENFERGVVNVSKKKKYPFFSDIDDDRKLYAVFCAIAGAVWPYFLYVAVTTIISHLKKH